jgi:glycerol-3-phosphate dehydrogenase
MPRARRWTIWRWLAGTAPKYSIRRVRGSHIVVPKLFDHDFAYIFQQPDTRICFAIPYEQDFTLIGTTDADHKGPLDTVEPDADEIRYLCDAVNRYFVKNITPADIVWTYAGVRALVDFGKDRPEAATRGYRLVLSARRKARRCWASMAASSPAIATWPRKRWTCSPAAAGAQG